MAAEELNSVRVRCRASGFYATRPSLPSLPPFQHKLITPWGALAGKNKYLDEALLLGVPTHHGPLLEEARVLVRPHLEESTQQNIY